MAVPVLLIAGPDPTSATGGHPSYVRAHAHALARAGFEPQLFCASRSRGSIVTDYGIVHRIFSPVRPVRQTTVPFHLHLLARAAARAVPRAETRAIAVHGMGVWGAIAVSVAERLRRGGTNAIPILSTYNTYTEEARGRADLAGPYLGRLRRASFRLEHRWVERAIEPLERRAYRNARLILYNYATVRAMVEAEFGPGLPLRRALYAPETAFQDRPPAAAGPEPATGELPLIVAISRHDPRKGLDVLLRALARLAQQQVPFRAIVVGGGPLLDAHRALAVELGLSGRVELPGEVPDVVPYLARATVFVHPAVREHSGSVSLLEALQAGLPVVTSACDGIPEDVRDGHDALLVTPGDPAALAVALGRVLADGALRRALGAEARRTFERRFSAAVFTEDLAAAYASVGVTPA